MKTDFEPFRKWFGFSRRERRSSIILVLIIVLTFSFRYLIPRSGMQLEELPASFYSGTLTGGVFSDSVRKASESVSDNRSIIRRTGRQEKSDRSGTDSSAVSIARQYQPKRELIELNGADSALLESLPGIGPVLSVRTIKYRELLGGFCSVNQLKEVYGLSEETFILIEKRLRVDTLKIRKIDINTADYGRLLRHPYFEKYEVASILKYRELKGRISGLNDLAGNKLLTIEKAAKLRPYLKFE